MWIIIWVVGYKLLQRWKRKIVIKNIKEEIFNLKTVAKLTPDNDERRKSIELAAKLWEKLKELEKEG